MKNWWRKRTQTSAAWWTTPACWSTPEHVVTPWKTKTLLSLHLLWHFIHTWNSSLSSGTMRKVRQPLNFFDLSTSPKMWSPTYRTSLQKLSGGSAILEMEHLPLAPISLERTSELPPLYTAESSKVPLWDPMLRRPVSLFTWRQWVECIDKSMNDQVQSPSTLCRSSPSLFVAANLTQHCALGKKAWFSGVNEGEIEVRLPGTSSVWGIREIQQVVHHLVHQSKFILSRSDCDTSGFKSPLLCTAPDWYTPSRCW